MKLIIFNGSPRGEKSNTKIILENFLLGFSRISGNSYEQYYLVETSRHPDYARIFRESEAVLLAFPLYTDAMPGIVKAFIEELAPVTEPEEAAAKKKLLFLVQSGFPEAVHLAAVEQYLLKLARRLHCDSPGVIIKAGAEGIQEMPPSMNRKLFRRLEALGENFGRTGSLDRELLKKIRGFKYFPAWMFPVLYLMKWSGLMDWYWNGTLKKNNAFERRFDRPYSG
jgi:NAD(P)H-dependent FMN reductase